MPWRAAALLMSTRRRWSLWGVLVLLVLTMLSTLVWLAGRYEVSQWQSRIERDTSDAVSDIRTALTRNVQTLQALQFANHRASAWQQDAIELLRDHREWLRLEQRDTNLNLLAHVDTPYRAPCLNDWVAVHHAQMLSKRAPWQSDKVGLATAPAPMCRRPTAVV